MSGNEKLNGPPKSDKLVVCLGWTTQKIIGVYPMPFAAVENRRFSQLNWRDFIRLLKSSYNLFDRHFFKFLKILAVPVFILFSLNSLLQFFFLTPDLIEKLNQREIGSLIKFITVFCCWLYIFVIILALYHIAILKQIQAVDHGEKQSMVDSYRRAWLLCRSYLGVSFLTIGKVLLWTLALFVPGIIFGVLYSFSSMVFVLEGKKGLSALSESKKLIKANLGKYLCCSLLLMLVVYLVFRALDFLLANTFGVNEPGGPFSLLSAIGEGLFGGCIAVLTLFPLIFMYYLYYDLKTQPVV